MSDRQPKAAASSPARELLRWAALPAAEVLAELGTSAAGLPEREAEARRSIHGPNRLPAARRRRWYVEFGRHFLHFFALLLWAGAGMAMLAGMPQLAWAIALVVVVNGLFSFWQEYHAERAAEALAALLPREVTVLRDGRNQTVQAADIVPGDLLVLAEGDSVPADARLTHADRLRVDLSALTGESRPVLRIAHSLHAPRTAPAGLANLVFAGTSIVSGRGTAVVFGTGAYTEFGRIAGLTQRQREQPSPLERELTRVTRFVTVLALSLGALCFLVGTGLGGLSLLDGFLFAIGIIVANVPEGLLPTLTLSLALGVRRMAAQKSLVKRLSAVETLGTTTVILTDKTGTLTENEMTARELWTPGATGRITGAGYDPAGSIVISPPVGDIFPEQIHDLLRTAALCCDAHLLAPGGGRLRWRAVGDPTEAALLVAAAKVGLTEGALNACPRIAELPFDSVRKRMSTIQRVDGTPLACVKGAPSEVLPRCSRIRRGGIDGALQETDHREAEDAHRRLAEQGLRVLAIACRTLPGERPHGHGWQPEDVEQDLTLLGFIAMEDPPRPEVPRALAACRSAGIRVVMVTGDDGRTAAAIAREIGMHATPPRVISGGEVDSMSDADLSAAAGGDGVLFARVTPEHKLRLVEVLQGRGEVVAVTGDGVNDAPALRRADIGVAMGATGTDVAREAATMVLADDNFASIVSAVREGRAVYDNVRKFVTYILASNVPEIVPFMAFVLLGVPLPLTVMQILAIDLGTDLFPALALGMEPPEPDLMERPPRRRGERLLNLPTLLRAYGFLGLIEAILGLFGFFATYGLAGWRPGQPLADSGPLYVLATTMSFAGIVACQVGNVFACRSEHQSVFRLGLAGNRAVLVGILVEVGLLVGLLYIPALAALFQLAPPRPAQWLLLAAFGPFLLALEEARKAIRRRFPANPSGG